MLGNQNFVWKMQILIIDSTKKIKQEVSTT